MGILWMLWTGLWVYWLLAIVGSTLVALTDVETGLGRLYLSALEAVFGWAVRFATPHEEEEDEYHHHPRHQQAQAKSLNASRSSSVESNGRAPRGIIEREASDILRNVGLPEFRHKETFANLADDVLDYARAAAEAIVDDDLTASFAIEELPFWNLLSRNKALYSHLNWRLQVIWGVGLVFRYVLLAPVRIAMLLLGLIFLSASTSALQLVEDEEKRKRLANWLTLTSFRLLSQTLHLQANFHDTENAKTQGGGICVANHTSPIDAVVLNTRVVYCLTGQIHGGWLGHACTALSRVVPHLWFERDQAKDRSYVKRMLSEHAANPAYPPTLIFPEGVCVNNTAVVMFKKGAFEASDVIYPIAMRYNSKYGDAFWAMTTWSEYIGAMLTSWTIVVDVYYMPPMRRGESETAPQFADRVKEAIADKLGLRRLHWDGRLYLYTAVNPNLIEEQRARLGKRLRHLSGEAGAGSAPARLRELGEDDATEEDTVSDQVTPPDSPPKFSGGDESPSPSSAVLPTEE